MPFVRSLLIALITTASACALADDPSATREQLKLLIDAAHQAEAEGERDDAIDAMQRAEAYARQAPFDDALPDILSFLVTRQIRAGQLDDARESIARMHQLDTANHGADYWRTRAGEAGFRYIDALQALDEAARKVVLKADEELAQIRALLEMGEIDAAVAVAENASEVMKKHLGEESSMFAEAQGKLGLALHAAERTTEAEPLLREALKRYADIYGEGHPSAVDFATALCEGIALQASQAEQQGALDEALALQTEAVTLLRSKVGHGHRALDQPSSDLLRLQRKLEPEPQRPLKTFFVDDFQRDSRARYRFSDEAEWQPGAMVFSKGVMLRDIATEELAEADLLWAFPDEWNGEEGYVRWGFATVTGDMLWIGIQRTRTADGYADEFMIGKFVASAQPQQQIVVRRWPLEPGSSGGLWQVRLDRQLLRVAHDGQVYYGWIGASGDNPINTFFSAADGLAGTLERLEVRGRPQREFTADHEQLWLAVRAYDQAEAEAVKQGDYERGFALRQISHGYRQSLFGEDDPRMAESFNAIGWFLQSSGNYRDALPYFEEALELARRGLGEVHPSTAKFWNNVAYAHARLGELDTAIAHYERVVGLSEMVHGEVHLDTATSLNNLGEAYGNRGDTALASEYIQRSLAIRRELAGEGSIAVARSLTLLAGFKAQLEEFDAAVSLSEQSVEILRQTLGEEHPATNDARLQLAQGYRLAGRPEQAETVAHQVFALRKVRFGPSDTRTRTAADQWEDAIDDQIARARHSADFSQAAELAGRKLEHKMGALDRQQWVVADLRNELEEYQAVAKFTPERLDQYHQATRLLEEANQHSQANEFEAALSAQTMAVDLLAETLGEGSRRYARELVGLSTLLAAAGKREEAIAVAERGLAACRTTYGDDHPALLSGYANLALLQEQSDLPDEAHQQLAEAKRILDATQGATAEDVATMAQRWIDVATFVATNREKARSWDRAQELRQQIAELTDHQFGPDHWKARDALLALARVQYLRTLDASALAELDQAQAWQDAAAVREVTDDWPAAIELHRRALETTTKYLGDQFPASLDAEAALGMALLKGRELEEATQRLGYVANARRGLLGEYHPSVAVACLNHGIALRESGQPATALGAVRTAIDIQRRAKLTATANYASSINTLAAICMEMGDDPAALRLLEEASALLKATQGADSRHYALCRSNLATLYHRMGDPRAAATLTDATLLVQNAYGEEHPEFAVMQEKAAQLHRSAGEWALAEELLQQALATKRRAYGQHHPATLDLQGELALVQVAQGAHEQGVATLREGVATAAEQLGTGHAGYSDLLTKLVTALIATGQQAEALRYQLAMVDSLATQFDALSAVQSERQQLLLSASYLHSLHLLLRLSAGTTDDPSEAYRRVLAWKGAVLTRQLQRRRAADDETMAPVVAELREVARGLAAIESARDEAESRATRAAQRARLLERKEALESQLASWAAVQPGAAKPTVALDDLREALPTGGVLVDYFVYQGSAEPGQEDRRRIVAFVVTPSRDVQRVELGAAADVETALLDWRKEIVRGAGGVRGDRAFRPQAAPAPEAAPQKLLRDRVWAPLEQHLGDARTVLVSPDGFLAQLPFAALPGRQRDSYLLEEYLLLSVPAPQLLSQAATGEGASRAATADELLLVGDVDFAAPLRSISPSVPLDPGGPTRGSLTQFLPLPATAVEVAAIETLFADTLHGAAAVVLKGADASEDMLRERMAGKKYLHFATHGFFREPPPIDSPNPGESDPATVLPGLQSGLVLAGANRGTRFSLSQIAADDDGLLTAVEVAEMDLRGVELAVLSACETGLGRVAGGEGLLGLQRSFHIAGAETVVSSLWQVDDEATRALMVEFYRNLWQRKQGRLEALRNAQLALLQGKLYHPSGAAGAESTRLPPRYWAAFTLSGQGE